MKNTTMVLTYMESLHIKLEKLKFHGWQKVLVFNLNSPYSIFKIIV